MKERMKRKEWKKGSEESSKHIVNWYILKYLKKKKMDKKKPVLVILVIIIVQFAPIIL